MPPFYPIFACVDPDPGSSWIQIQYGSVPVSTTLGVLETNSPRDLIRIYYSADPDPGPYFSPVGSGSGVGVTQKTSSTGTSTIEKNLNLKLNYNYFCNFTCFLGDYFFFLDLVVFWKELKINTEEKPYWYVSGSVSSLPIQIGAQFAPNPGCVNLKKTRTSTSQKNIIIKV